MCKVVWLFFPFFKVATSMYDVLLMAADLLCGGGVQTPNVHGASLRATVRDSAYRSPVLVGWAKAL